MPRKLATYDNPFALAVMAHLQAQATRRDPTTRFDAKLALVRRLYQRGYSASSVTRLLRFIDWVLQLSDELTPLFWREVDTMEQIKPVPYRMKFERDYFAAKKAMRKSKREMRKALLAVIEAYLDLKFGDDGLELLPAISPITDTNKLQAILTALRSDITLAEVQQLAAPD